MSFQGDKGDHLPMKRGVILLACTKGPFLIPYVQFFGKKKVVHLEIGDALYILVLCMTFVHSMYFY